MAAGTEDSGLRLLLDEHISDKVADRLNKRGHDVVASTTAPSLKGLSDPRIFAAAQDQERIFVTYNRSDFESIIREYAAYGREHCGLVVVGPQQFPSRELNRLAKALDRLSPPPGGSFVIWLKP